MTLTRGSKEVALYSYLRPTWTKCRPPHPRTRQNDYRLPISGSYWMPFHARSHVDDSGIPLVAVFAGFRRAALRSRVGIEFSGVNLSAGYISRHHAFMNASTYSQLYFLFDEGLKGLRKHHSEFPGLPLIVYGSRQPTPLPQAGQGKEAPSTPPREMVQTVTSRKRFTDGDDDQEKPPSKVARQ